MRSALHVLGLALADLRKERLLSFCSFFGLAAVLAPLLILYGVKFGVMQTLTDRLLSDPNTLEISPVSSGDYTLSSIAELRNLDGVSFVLPRTRSIAATMTLLATDGDGRSRKAVASLEPTDKGDPLLAHYGAPSVVMVPWKDKEAGPAAETAAESASEPAADSSAQPSPASAAEPAGEDTAPAQKAKAPTVVGHSPVVPAPDGPAPVVEVLENGADEGQAPTGAAATKTAASAGDQPAPDAKASAQGASTPKASARAASVKASSGAKAPAEDAAKAASKDSGNTASENRASKDRAEKKVPLPDFSEPVTSASPATAADKATGTAGAADAKASGARAAPKDADRAAARPAEKQASRGAVKDSATDAGRKIDTRAASSAAAASNTTGTAGTADTGASEKADTGHAAGATEAPRSTALVRAKPQKKTAGSPLTRRPEADDPRLREAGVVLSDSAARKLGVSRGAVILGVVERAKSGRVSSAYVRLRVHAVLPLAAQQKDTLWAPLELVEACEDFRDGRAVPSLGEEMGWSGELRPATRIYAGFRLYAADLHSVTRLHDVLAARGIETYTHAEEIEQLTTLERGLNFIFSLICVAALAGFLSSTVSSVLAGVQRKQRVLGLLQLMGFSKGVLVLFPLTQVLATALAGTTLALGAYALVAHFLNQAFAGSLQGLEQVCRLEATHILLAYAAALGASFLAALPAARLSTRIEPSEVIRDV